MQIWIHCSIQRWIDKEKNIKRIKELSYFIEDYPGEIIWYLGKSIQFLSQADIAYFGGDWRNTRGCKVEHEVAMQYGIDRIEE